MILTRRDLCILVIFLGVMAINYVWMEREYSQMKAALEKRVPCEQIPARESGPVKRYRYDPQTGRLIDVETGEAW
ncbi:MAG: hypothetical protein DIU65_13400 [Proteobacteria bacterium]|nr:MAG: hypothetical protein DIU65_13400 [Pseudomonadota bacterium]